MTTAIYHATGLTCEHCVRAVTTELESVRGVDSVMVTLVPGGHSALIVTSDAPLSAETVEEVLLEAGNYRLTR